MATTSITANRQAYASSGDKSAWLTARNATTANSFSNYTGFFAVDNSVAIREFSQYSIRPETYAVNRTFLFFDLSGINGTITAMTLKVYGVTNASINVRPAKSTAFANGASNFVASDFDNWSPSSPTTYTSTAGQAWSTNQYNTFNLNSTARSDANTDGYLNLVLLGSSNDYPNSTPTANFDRKAGVRFNNTAAPITLDITYTPTNWDYVINGVSAKTELLSGYIAISGVSYGTIESVNDVPPSPFNSNIGTGFNNEVRSIAIQSNSQILVGGDYTSFNGSTRNRLVRLNPNGTEDTAFYNNLGAGFNGEVHSVVVQTDGKILVGGAFTSFKGNTRNNLVRLNSDGTEDTAFYNNLGLGFLNSGTSQVFDIAVQSNNQILVGGSYNSFNGNTRRCLVRLNSTGIEDTTFYGNLGTGFGSGVFSIAIQSNDQILVGGSFISLNSTSRLRLVRLNSSGTEDTTFYGNLGAGFNSTLRSIVIQSNNQILVGGDYTSFNSNTRNRLVRLNSTGIEDTTFYGNLGTGFSQSISKIILSSTDKIVVGGLFQSVDGNTRFCLARLNSSGTVDTSFGTTSTQTDARVFDIIQTSTSDLIVGGVFTNWAGDLINRIVKLDSDGLIIT